MAVCEAVGLNPVIGSLYVRIGISLRGEIPGAIVKCLNHQW